MLIVARQDNNGDNNHSLSFHPPLINHWNNRPLIEHQLFPLIIDYNIESLPLKRLVTYRSGSPRLKPEQQRLNSGHTWLMQRLLPLGHRRHGKGWKQWCWSEGDARQAVMLDRRNAGWSRAPRDPRPEDDHSEAPCLRCVHCSADESQAGPLVALRACKKLKRASHPRSSFRHKTLEILSLNEKIRRASNLS